MSDTSLVVAPSGRGLVDVIHERLIRLQASARFRDLASRFAATRPVARRRAAALFDLCAGFVYSQTLLAAVELDLPRLLLDQPGDAASLAPRLALPPDAASRLLDACVALRLAGRRRDGAYRLGPLGAALIDNPGVDAMIRHHALLYRDLQDPVALLRRGPGGTALAGYWPYAGQVGRNGLDTAGAAPYSALMAASQAMVAAEVLAAYDVRRHRCLLDVGGGSGAFVEAAARRAPELQLMLLDLPAVAALARTHLAQAGLSRRLQVFDGDFTTDTLPRGADLITLVRVLHDHDDDVVRALLARVRAALPPDGRLLIAEPMSGTRGAEASGDAYFGLYLFAMGSGRPRRPQRLSALLRESGFASSRLLKTRTPLVARVIIAW